MTPAAVQAAPAKTAASPAMTPAAVQAAPAMTAASPAMTPAAVQAAPAMTPAAVQAAPAKTAASPAMTPAAVQAAPAMTPAAVQAAPAMTAASPAMTPAAVQAAPAMTAASPAMTPAAVQAAPAMTPAAVQAAPAMTPAAVQAAPATTNVIQSGDPARGGAGDVAITPDVKQHAVWLLHEAREQMAQGNFDAAEKKIAEAEAIDIKWGLFDDTPTKVRTDLNKERPKNLASTSKPAQSLPHNRENAHALLREARAALANHQIDQAEAIAQEVKSWNLSYSFFGDNPDKVAAAARALRKRDKIRNTPTRERASQGVYDVLVQESRQLMKLGKLNEAEAKALQAQRMNVVPALTADRAESVLHDIAMARVRSGSGSPAATPAAEPPSLVAEHEANDLLDKGDQAKAAAKFVESEKLRDKESGRAAIGQALATAAPAVDVSIQKSPGAEPATEPLPAAPGAAGSPTPDKPAAPAPDSQPKPEPPGQGDARRHPARLDRRPLISLPLLPSTASPSLNRLARAMRWRHPARLDRRPLISLPLLPSTASPSLNRLARAMRWRHPARLDRRPLISLPLLPSTASPSLNRLARAMRWRHPARLDRRPLISLPLLLLDSQPKPEPPGQGDALAAPGAAGSPTPDKPAAPAPDSQPKPEPPGQGDALAAPGAAGSPTPDKPAAPALDSQPKPEPPGQGDALAAPGAAGSPTPDKPAAPALDSQPKPEPPGQGDALAAPGAAGSPTPDKPAAPALDSQPKPEPPGQGDALAAPGAAGSPTPDKPAAPALDSQPKPEPPGQGDAPAAPGAAGSPTPDKPAAPAPDSTSKPAQSLPHNRENARALLREARAALANHQIDQAEAIAQEVKSWNLSYGFFGENPDKVAAAARALRKRDKIRNTPTRERASQGVYDVLVQESRQLMKLGKLNEAEAKALQAQRMNVVPALTADRAESVLHDIAMARVRSGSGSPAATPAAEPPSLVAEHEANDLLDKGDQAKAAAKFAESEKLRDKESGRAAIGQAPATAAPAVDASIQKSSGALPATEPLPAAPGAAGSPTPDTPAAPAPDSQPKPEPPGQGDAPAAPGAAGFADP